MAATGNNAFWTAYSIRDLIEAEAEPLRTALRAQQQRIRDATPGYQRCIRTSKGDNDIPFT